MIFCSANERACGVDHVVKQDAGLALNVADDVHDLGLIGLFAALIDDGHVAAELHGEVSGAGGAADIGGYDHYLIVVLAENVDIMLCKERCAEKVIDGNVEEALDLSCVQVHGEHAVSAGCGYEICHELCGDGVAALCLAVLAGIAEIRNDRGDSACGGSADCVDHDEQLHEVIVDGLAGGLHDENVGAANGLMHRDGALAVGKMRAGALAEVLEKLIAYLLCEPGVGVSGEHLYLFTMGNHFKSSSLSLFADSDPVFIHCIISEAPRVEKGEGYIILPICRRRFLYKNARTAEKLSLQAYIQ